MLSILFFTVPYPGLLKFSQSAEDNKFVNREQTNLIQFNPYRRMVTGFVPAAHVLVHAGTFQLWQNFAGEQEMIYPHAGIALVSLSEIIPKSIDGFIRVKMPKSIGPALPYEIFKCITNFGKE